MVIVIGALLCPFLFFPPLVDDFPKRFVAFLRPLELHLSNEQRMGRLKCQPQHRVTPFRGFSGLFRQRFLCTKPFCTVSLRIIGGKIGGSELSESVRTAM